MSSTKNYKDFILDELSILDNISYKPMMGEYLLYYNGMLFGGIYDNRLLIKKTNSNQKYNLTEEVPYESAKPMYSLDNIDNKEILKNIIIDTYKDLK